jgi:hypothetical protein
MTDLFQMLIVMNARCLSVNAFENGKGYTLCIMRGIAEIIYPFEE